MQTYPDKSFKSIGERSTDKSMGRIAAMMRKMALLLKKAYSTFSGTPLTLFRTIFQPAIDSLLHIPGSTYWSDQHLGSSLSPIILSKPHLPLQVID